VAEHQAENLRVVGSNPISNIFCTVLFYVSSCTNFNKYTNVYSYKQNNILF
jgi:hypothetical protein